MEKLTCVGRHKSLPIEPQLAAEHDGAEPAMGSTMQVMQLVFGLVKPLVLNLPAALGHVEKRRVLTRWANKFVNQ